MGKENKIETNPLEIKQDREYRASSLNFESDKMELYGTPLIFNKPTQIKALNRNGDIVEFTEIISERALDNCDMTDTAFKHNHKEFLARVRNKSLVLTKTDTGLEMRAVLSDTQRNKDIYTEVKDGLLPEMSFSFPKEQSGTKCKWEKRSDGSILRTILEIPKLIDVSTAYNGAYSDTNIYARSLEELDSENETLDNEKRTADINLLKQKIIMKGKI
jgi:HK97 family phage prohead protease